MERQHHYAKEKWAKVLGVSRSGYYAWLETREARAERYRKQEKAVLEIFEQGKGHYGAERISGIIRENGGHASFGVVKRIMQGKRLKSSHCTRRQRSLTDSSKARDDRYRNLTKDLTIDRPFQVLSSDITYIRTGEGFDYLCQIRDVYTNTVLGQCQQQRMTKDLVLNTIQAVERRWPIPEGAILHSDRGSQYTAKSVAKLVERLGWTQSFSRVGKPGDNAWSESFFSILKKEIIHWRFYPTRESARQRVFEYIEIYYNRQRKQKRLGYLSPIQFLNRWLDQYQSCVA
jgi:putative transposase